MKKIHSGEYHILDASITHNQLLLRCAEEEANHDLLFIGVTQISLPFRAVFNIIQIELQSDTSLVNFVLKNDDYIIGEIRALQLKAQENNLTAAETSIPSEMERLSGVADDLEELLKQIDSGEYSDIDDWITIFPPPMSN